MCLPELIFFDDSSRDRHSRRRGNAMRPHSVDSNDQPPLLSSPPFVVQVSPKLGHHHHNHHHRPFIRYQPGRRRIPSREREEMEWRNGFRAGREAAHKREEEEKSSRSFAAVKKDMIAQGRLKVRVPEAVAVVEPMTSSSATPTKPVTGATRETAQPDVMSPLRSANRQTEPTSQLPTTIPTRQAPTSDTIPALVLPPAAIPVAPTANPVSQQQQSSRRNIPLPSQQDKPYTTHEHRRFYQGPHRRISPSSSSTDNSKSSQQNLRRLQHRISTIWAHVIGLEQDRERERDREVGQKLARERERERERDRKRDRERANELRLRRAMELDAMDEKRQQLRRRRGMRILRPEQGYDDGFAGEGISAVKVSSLQPRRVREVVIVDERDRNRDRDRDRDRLGRENGAPSVRKESASARSRERTRTGMKTRARFSWESGA